MEWTKVEVCTTQYGAEIVTAILLENKIVGAEIINPKERVRHLAESAPTWDYADEKLFDDSSEEVCVVFYVEKNEQGERLLSDVREGLAQLDVFDQSLETAEVCNAGAFEIKIESADDETWLHEWKKHFKPLRVGRVVIVPQWEEYQRAGEEIIFSIDPGSAFGTGQHQTTQLCISALQKYLHDGGKLLDVGCGSGILSIIGLLLGANEVFACDIDPAGAIAATKKNASLNSVDISRLQIHSGDVLSDFELRTKLSRSGEYEVIVANIVADVVMELVPFIKKILAHDGVFIASGIIDEREEEVLAVFNEYKFEIVEKLQLEGWCCIVGKA